MNSAIIEICNRKPLVRDICDSLPSLNDAKREELYASYVAYADKIGDRQFLRKKHRSEVKAVSSMIEAAAEGVRKCVGGIEDGELVLIVTYRTKDGYEEDDFLPVKGLAAHNDITIANTLIDAYRQASGTRVTTFVEAFTPIFQPV